MQLTFGKISDPKADDCWSRLLEAIRAAVTAITPKELAFAHACNAR